MTIGQLSKRTGLSLKALRRLEGMGLIYSVGRSPAGYRLLDQTALGCAQVLGTLRSLGLTLAEVRQLGAVHLARDRPAPGRAAARGALPPGRPRRRAAGAAPPHRRLRARLPGRAVRAAA
jgi:DNA-binding transcriptional MerR regulator